MQSISGEIETDDNGQEEVLAGEDEDGSCLTRPVKEMIEGKDLSRRLEV